MDTKELLSRYLLDRAGKINEQLEYDENGKIINWTLKDVLPGSGDSEGGSYYESLPYKFNPRNLGPDPYDPSQTEYWLDRQSPEVQQGIKNNLGILNNVLRKIGDPETYEENPDPDKYDTAYSMLRSLKNVIGDPQHPDTFMRDIPPGFKDKLVQKFQNKTEPVEEQKDTTDLPTADPLKVVADAPPKIKEMYARYQLDRLNRK